MQPTTLISAEALLQRLGSPGLTIFDASWYMPAQQRDTRAEFAAAHIPGAVYFDLDALSDQATSLPHMLPATERFEADLRALGLDQGDMVVVYDTAGLFSAPRVWWMLKLFGIAQVFVLDGGLPAWRKAGGAVEAGEPAVTPGNVMLAPDRSRVTDLGAVRDNLGSHARDVVDARAAPRFTGEAADPRPNVAPGHIPQSFNVPFTQMLTAEGKLKPEAELRRAFAEAGVDVARPLITSCGSGVTAAVLTLALAGLGQTDVRLYDGSWSEWGAHPDTPKAMGPR